MAEDASPTPLDGTTHYVAAVLAGLRRRGAGPVVRWGGRSVTGDELHRCVVGTTANLRALGIGGGSTVGVLTEAMSPRALVARYAAHLLGATVVHLRTAVPSPSAPPIPLDAQAAIVGQAGVDLLLVDAENAGRGGAVAARAARSPRVAEAFGPLGAAADPTAELPATITVPDPAVVTFTSGSTGEPKGVAEGFAGLNNRILLGYPALTAGTERPVFLATCPVSHADGPFMDLTLAAGGTVVLPEVIDADTMLTAIAAERVTSTSLSVPELYALLDHPDLAVTDVSSLRQMLYTGYPASPERLTQAVKHFGDALMQGYGTTETGPVSLLLPHEHRDPALVATVGRPLPGVEVTIHDPDSGAELPAGAEGEIRVRSAIMMTEYLADPELTARTISDGRLRTGDLGRLDEAGYLHVLGRIDDVIKVRATKVHPAVVEKALLTHPDIANAAVYAGADPDGLARVHAAVTLRPGAGCTAAELREHVAATLPETQAPVRFAVVDPLPRTASGRKVDRPRLRREDADATALD